jgi:dephospho-CoA kinase
MRVIGLTGGIGSGKSLTASLLEKLGAYIIDADKISRDVVKKGSSVLEELVEYFGTEILSAEGELDRKKLASSVFDYPKKLKRLNDIVHKEVYKQIKWKLYDLNKESFDGIVILDVPIPTGEFIKLSEQIWTVDAELDKRISRVIERSGFSKEEAEKRINSQLSREEYLNLADRIIPNNGTVNELNNIIQKLYKEAFIST